MKIVNALISSLLCLSITSTVFASENKNDNCSNYLAGPHETGYRLIKAAPVDPRAILEELNVQAKKNPDFVANLGSYGGMDGRLMPTMVGFFKVVYKIGGKKFKYEELVDKSIRIRLKDKALKTALAIDAANENHAAFDLVMMLLEYKSGFRTGDVESFSATRNKHRADGTILANLEAAPNPSLLLVFNDGSYMREPGSPDSSRGNSNNRFEVANDLLDKLFVVDSISPYRRLSWPKYQYRLSQIKKFVTLKGENISDQVLEALSGGALVEIMEKGETQPRVGLIVAAKRTTNKNEDVVSIRLLESNSSRPPLLLNCNMSSGELQSLKVVNTPSRFGHSPIPVGMRPIRLDPNQSNVVTVEREVDLKQPVRITVVNGQMIMPYEGILKLPTEDERATAVAANEPMRMSLQSAGGDSIEFDALNLFAIEAHPIH